MLRELTTSDCDELSECLVDTDQQYRQLEPGKFRGHLRSVEFPGVHIAQEFMSHRIAVKAVVSGSSVVLFIPMRQTGRITLEGHDCDRGDVHIGQPGTSASLSLPSNFVSLSVELNVQAIRRMAEAKGVSYIIPSPLSRLPGCSATHALRRSISDAFSYATRATALTPLVNQQLADRVLAKFIESIRVAAGHAEPIDRSRVLSRRLAAMDVADYATANLATPLSLAEMCEISQVSERSLRDGFREVFGVSPLRFIKSLRLAAARQDLKMANRRTETVASIATKWGFSQLAHFATDFNSQFGERPSELLSRSQ